MIHELTSSQFIAAPLSRVWSYFSDPKNLNELTPPSMHFEIKSNPGLMYTGQMIAYRIRILPGIKLSWLTEIRHVKDEAYFVDEQRIGPYRIWYHEHRFVAQNRGVLMTDKVTYALPFGILGEVVHLMWVKRQLRGIFDYRTKKVNELFNGS